MREVIKFFVCVVIFVVLWKNLDTLLYVGNLLVNTICDKAIQMLK